MNIIKKALFKFLVWLPYPIKKNRLFFSSIPTMSDNCLALYYYIKENHNNKYDIYWQINKGDKNKLGYKKVVYKSGNIFQKIKYYHYLKSSHIIVITHHQLPIRKGQKLITLWHGEPFKKWSNDVSHLVYDSHDNWFVTSNENTKKIRSDVYRLKNVNFITSPQCRLWFFQKKDLIDAVSDYLYSLSIRKFLVFMPTFKGIGREDNFFDVDFKLIDNTLEKNDAFLFIKLHPHYSLDSYKFLNTYNRIRFVDNRFFENNNLELYSFLALSSGLITDISSVFIDYMFLDKPICFYLNEPKTIFEKTIFETFNYPLPGVMALNSADLNTFIENVCSPEQQNGVLDLKENKLIEFYRPNNSDLSSGPKVVEDLINSIIFKKRKKEHEKNSID